KMMSATQEEPSKIIDTFYRLHTVNGVFQDPEALQMYVTNKEKAQKEMDKVNIQDFCKEHYDDILPIIMDKVRRDKRKKALARLDFGESSEKGRRAKEGSQNSSVGVSPPSKEKCTRTAQRYLLTKHDKV
ncbi:hypothetical protein Tco_0203062, partial [Tanacetum coccineum]